MENIRFLTKVLTDISDYWVVATKNESTSFGRTERMQDDIFFISISSKINRGLNKDDIKLTDLYDLQSIQFDCNIHLSGEYPPFQYGMSFYNVYDGFPVEKKSKEFFDEAIRIKSKNLYDYSKLYQEVLNETTGKF